MILSEVMQTLRKCKLKIEAIDRKYSDEPMYSYAWDDCERNLWETFRKDFGDREVVQMVGGIDTIINMPYLVCKVNVTQTEFYKWSVKEYEKKN